MKQWVKKLCLSFFITAALLPCSRAEDFVIGLVDVQQTSSQNDYLKQTIDILSRVLHQKVRIIDLNSEEFKEGLTHNDFLAFIAPVFEYRQSVSKGFKDVAALVYDRSNDPNHSEGISLFVDTEVSPILRLAELRGKKIGILAGYPSTRAILESLILKQKDPKEDFWMVETFSDVNTLLSELKEKNLDAVALPACYLEEHAAEVKNDTSWLLPLNGKVHSSMACVHSSVLYPGIIFGLSSMASPEVVSKVSASLLTMSKGRAGEHWRIVTDFRVTDNLLESLDLDENAPLRKPGIKKFFSLYWYLFVIGGVVLFVVLLSSAILSYLVRRKTAQLHRSLITQKELEEEAKEAFSRLEKLQKLGAVGQMSSLFAHEIRQPLNAILCYAFTLERIIDKQKETIKDSSVAQECLTQIQEQSARLDQIVEKVRGYLKNRTPKRGKCDLVQIIGSACDSFKTTSSGRLPFKFVVSVESQEIEIFADPLEIELALVNLFRNSVQAQEANKKTKIIIKAEKVNGFCILSVEDNGPKLSVSKLESFTKNQPTSTNPQGLGLGLSIVRFLIESHGGSVEFFSGRVSGLKVLIKLPLRETTENGQK